MLKGTGIGTTDFKGTRKQFGIDSEPPRSRSHTPFASASTRKLYRAHLLKCLPSRRSEGKRLVGEENCIKEGLEVKGLVHHRAMSRLLLAVKWCYFTILRTVKVDISKPLHCSSGVDEDLTFGQWDHLCSLFFHSDGAGP
jgi:hypothetical protein